MNLNSFKPKPKSSEDTEKQLNHTGMIARQCLTHEDFKHYRKQYEKAEAQAIDALIQETERFMNDPSGDVGKFAMMVVRRVTRLQDLRLLLNVVDKDAKKGANETDKS